VPETVGPAAASAVPERETQNLLTLAAHQIVWRVGWTFKTESIIVPAFLDNLAGQGWVRGLLPLLKYLGQSVPPVFSAETLKAVRQKKWALAVLAALASLPYLVLAGVFLAFAGQKQWWMAPLLLAVQLVFFGVYGLYLIAFGTVQGKLIRPTRRGQLLWGATFWGLFPTILFCWWLMPGWLESPVPGYGYLFLSVGIAFLGSALIVGLLREPSSAAGDRPPAPANGVTETVRTLRRDPNLRRLVAIILLSGMGLVVIPHYQWFARERLGLTDANLVLFVITHTTAVTVYSLVLGPAADRWGYRLTLRLTILGAAIAPAYALFVPRLASVGPEWFWVVFIPLGLTPLVPTILANYALELCAPHHHPRYLSIVNLALFPPFLLSPAVGKVVDLAGFEAVAGATFFVMLGCAGLTFWLDEPRRKSSCQLSVDSSGCPVENRQLTPDN
jgi:hypothetical protein